MGPACKNTSQALVLWLDNSTFADAVTDALGSNLHPGKRYPIRRSPLIANPNNDLEVIIGYCEY
jgi:hypothetical protein